MTEPAGPVELGEGKTAAATPRLPGPVDAAPDPLTPPETTPEPILAPGATAAAPAVAAPAPAEPAVKATAEQPKTDKAEAAPAPIHPVLAEIRKRLGDARPGEKGSDRADRNGLASFYAAANAQPVWTTADGFSAKAAAAIAELRRADDWGLDASQFDVPADIAGQSAPAALAAAEIKLGLAVLKYARHARGGRLDPQSVSNLFDRKLRFFEPSSVMQGIASAATADGYLRGLHPQHKAFEHLRVAYNAERAKAHHKSEPKHAKLPDSAVRLLVNMERWRWMPDNLGAFHVINNIPEQLSRAFKDGKVVFQERIVVGKTITPTPQFTANMQFVIFNPEWGVPDGIKVNEIGPALRRGNSPSAVLERAGGLKPAINGRPVDPNSVDWSSVDMRQVSLIQPAGGRNVLGQVKFRFPNRHDVYMHDTQEKSLFNNSVRAYSHGCMRVQNPLRFAEVLLGHDKGWGSEKIQNYVRNSATVDIKLTSEIPVHVVYFTAFSDDDGKIHTKSDLYALDSRVSAALMGKPLPPEKVPEKPEEKVAKAIAKAKPTRVASKQQDTGFNIFSAMFGN